MQEIMEAKVDFEVGTVDHTGTLRFNFNFEVKTAIVIFKGFQLEYSNDHNVRKIGATVGKTTIDGKTVTAPCTYEMYDDSGNKAGGTLYGTCYAWNHEL